MRSTYDNDTIPGPVRDQMVQEVIFSCAKNALEQVLGSSKGSGAGTKTLFTIDASMGGYNVQPVFTYPPKHNNGNENINESMMEVYKHALKILAMPDGIATFVAEPVGAVRGAKYHNILPASPPGPVLVIDIGATSSSMSIVSDNEEVRYHSCLDGFGGETLVEALMDYLSKSFYKSSFLEVQDKMGVQRLYDAAQDAVLEISGGNRKNHGRVQINIPYLSVWMRRCNRSI